MEYLPSLITAYGVFLIGAASPGPNVLAIMGTSMSDGRQYGVALAVGIAAGSFVWGLLAWIGLTSIIEAHSGLAKALQITGGLYLFWLSARAFRSSRTSDDLKPRSLSLVNDLGVYFRRGLIIQMTNPKSALTWTAIMSLGMSAQAPLWVGGAVVAGTTFLSALAHLAYALVFSTDALARVYLSKRKWIELTLSIFFAFAACRLIGLL